MTVYLRHGQIAVAMDVEVNKDQSTEKGKKNRYVLSGVLIAGRITTTVPAVGDPTVEESWYHLDHLNSTKMVTDESGEVVVSYVYRAFGEQLKRLDASGQDTDDRAKYSYGGKELDNVTNLYYFNARYYDATIGRFINVDPVQDGGNWYVYCGNNPLCFMDPTGLENNKTKMETIFFTNTYLSQIKFYANQGDSFWRIDPVNEFTFFSWQDNKITHAGDSIDGITYSLAGSKEVFKAYDKWTYFGIPVAKTSYETYFSKYTLTDQDGNKAYYYRLTFGRENDVLFYNEKMDYHTLEIVSNDKINALEKFNIVNFTLSAGKEEFLKEYIKFILGNEPLLGKFILADDFINKLMPSAVQDTFSGINPEDNITKKTGAVRWLENDY